MHESTGCSPLYLMFGCHPLLAINAFLGISSSEKHKVHQDYVDWLKDRLQYAYEEAEVEARKTGTKYKKYYDQETRTSLLMPGDRAEVGCSRKTQDKYVIYEKTVHIYLESSPCQIFHCT